MIARLGYCPVLCGLAVALVVLSGAGLLRAQEQKLSVQKQYDAEAAKYRAAIEAAGRDGPKILALRDEHRARLNQILSDAGERGLASIDADDLLTLGKIATEVAEWRLVIEIHRCAEAAGNVDPLLSRLALHAHIQLGELDAAERRLTEIQRLDPLNREIGAAHIAFANSYEKQGNRSKTSEHLGEFLCYVIDSLERAPTLADAVPSLLSRFEGDKTHTNDALIKSLRDRLAPLLGRVTSDPADSESQKTVTFSHVNAVYFVAAALAARGSPANIEGICPLWAQSVLTILNRKTSLSPAEKQEVLAFLLKVGRLADLLDSRTDVKRLMKLHGAIESATLRFTSPTEIVAIRRAFEESRHSLDLRERHLGLIGKRLSRSSLESLIVQGSTLNESKPLVVLIWSPITPKAAGVLERVRTLVQLRSGTQLVIVVPYRNDGPGSDEKRVELENRWTRLARRDPTNATGGIAFLDVNSPAMKELEVAILPQIVVLDASSAIRSVTAGGDGFELWLLERSLDSLHAFPPDCSRMPAKASLSAPHSRLCSRGNRAFLGRCKRIRR
ncbi:MAG: hypothetical protein L0Y58_09975 [Verrucomicrobia subdivision 3 bacterium]|nr:hypothetical protein [Limisphaerales bacterium]